MKARGASRQEIQNALDAMPKRGPGLSTKTGSAQGIGKDITNILDTLRIDVNKQRALDDTRKRADIMALGGMKRADQEKGITAKSDITTTEGAGRERNIDKKQEGAILVGKAEAANLISKLTNEQASRLKEFALKEKGIDKLENLPKEALAEFIKLEELRLKKEKSITDRIAAGKKGKPKDASIAGILGFVNKNILVSQGFKIDENDPDNITLSDGTKLTPEAAKKAGDIIKAEKRRFMDLVIKEGATTNEAYNKAYLKWLGGVESKLKQSTSKKSSTSKKQTPAVGTVRGGYKYKGGNPSNSSSWEPV